jgi:triphosphatase
MAQSDVPSPGPERGFEIELKFQIPAPALAAVRRAVKTATAQQVRLQARYFDTAERQLAKAGIALRLRKEGRQWVQTAKARGDGLMQRLEHNVPIAGAGEPTMDIARHDGTPTGEAMRRALPDPGALKLLFATDVRRTHRRLHRAGATVELALDEGVIVDGEATLPISELEFELLRGPAQPLLDVAARWVQRHGLWLDVRTKAEMGDRLSRAALGGPAVFATPLRLSAQLDAPQALREMLRNCLAQVLPNASEIGAGRFGPEHVHQLRVGLRRLRTALREFGDVASDAGRPERNAQRDVALKRVFTRLGETRDRDALAASLLPALQAAGAPSIELPSAQATLDPGELLLGTEFNRLMLEIIGLTQPLALLPAVGAASEAPLPATPLLRPWLQARLKRLRRQVVDDGARFAEIEEVLQHRVRKRLKRLRYCAEFAQGLYKPKAVKAFLKVVRRAQDALGEYNDVLVAQAAFRQRLAQDPQVWFALGWLAERRQVVLERCVSSLHALADARRFWG